MKLHQNELELMHRKYLWHLNTHVSVEVRVKNESNSTRLSPSISRG